MAVSCELGSRFIYVVQTYIRNQRTQCPVRYRNRGLPNTSWAYQAGWAVGALIISIMEQRLSSFLPSCIRCFSSRRMFSDNGVNSPAREQIQNYSYTRTLFWELSQHFSKYNPKNYMLCTVEVITYLFWPHTRINYKFHKGYQVPVIKFYSLLIFLFCIWFASSSTYIMEQIQWQLNKTSFLYMLHSLKWN
jgi:hypothetical protein